MKVPKYIEAALERRKRAARAWLEADGILTKFIISKGLDTVIASEDFGGGVEGLTNAEESNRCIRQAIEEH